MLPDAVSFNDEMDSYCDLIGVNGPTSRCSAKEEPILQNHTAIAADVAKAVFAIALCDRRGHVCRRTRLARTQVPVFFAQQPAATVVMEACGSAHYWGREFQKLGRPEQALESAGACSSRAACNTGL